MKQKALAVMLVLALSAGTASAQFGFGGVVYDPTNYHNALLRYFQLQQQLIQLRNSYAELVAQYNLAIRMAKNIPNMPARYRALFSQWRNTGARDVYGNTQTIESRISNLEEDSLSGDPNLNTEVSVLNKINAANVLTLRTVQDSNKLLASLLEQQTILSKQQREATANAINAEIARRRNLAGNMARLTSTLTDSLENFRMP